MPVDGLQAVRVRVASEEFGLPADMQNALLARIDDLIEAIGAGDRAIAKLPRPAVAEAAARLALVRYLTGQGWRKLVTDAPAVAAAAAVVEQALPQALADTVAVVERVVAASTAGAQVTVRGSGSYAIPCAVCGGDAIALTATRVSATALPQLMVGSLSPVTVFRPVAGPRMHDLIALLEAGDAAAVVKHLRDTQPGGCDAWCGDCQRVFCKDHYAIEAQWSGSWHEATYATCPLGHLHTID